MKARILLATAALLAASSANAASASWYLDQSNTEGTWADGVNYLLVTISDSLANPGDIEFLVTPLDRTVAVPQMNNLAGTVTQALNFNVAR